MLEIYLALSASKNFSCTCSVIKKKYTIHCMTVKKEKKIICINCKHSLILFIKQKQCTFQNFELSGCYAITVKHKKPFVTLKGLNISF